jgi:DNA-directed RNA polymerase specialized sigma subunit
MTAKEYLAQIKHINNRLLSQARQHKSLTDALHNISPNVGSITKAATPNIHRMEDLIAAKVDLENEMAEESAALAKITVMINTLPDPLHSSIITSRYISRLPWSKIAKELFVSESRIYQLHREALAEIEKITVNYS